MKKLEKCLFASFKIALAVFLLPLHSNAAVHLHSLFSDNMVLQRDAKTAVFGFADEDTQITVEIAGQKKQIMAKKGKWKVSLDPVKAGGPYTLTVTGKDGAIMLKNVVFGDVWVASGQSNMQTKLQYYKKCWPDMYKDIPGSYCNKNIRYFTVSVLAADEPLEKIEPQGQAKSWRVCDPESSDAISATGYFFSKMLQEKTGVPVGLVVSAVGGTSISCWLSQGILSGSPESKPWLDDFARACSNFPAANAKYQGELAKWRARKAAGEKNLPREPRQPLGPDSLKRPAGLYNAMISPLTDCTIKGVIWYQGESDQSRPAIYRELFSALIRSWRQVWGQGDFPFYYVQLASYMKTADTPQDPAWARLREAQAKALSLPNTAMAVAIDAGLQKDVHPPFKQVVGERLCALALHNLYGQDVPCAGPSFAGMKIEGGKAVLSFDGIGGGLVAKGVTLDGNVLPEGVLKGFSVCGEDRIFKWADAVIQGKKVVVSSSAVPKVVAVRYGWAYFPLCNLYNQEGFPAVPFRTDDFAGFSIAADNPTNAAPAPAPAPKQAPADPSKQRPYLLSDKALERLNLTDAQKQQYEVIVAERQEANKDLMPQYEAACAAGDMEKKDALLKKILMNKRGAFEKIEKILTDDQRAEFKKICGENRARTR